METNIFIHETSIIDENVKIGNNTKIWHWSHVSEGAEIGENCTIGQNVFIGKNVKIGNNCKIQNNVSVFQNVVLEDDVFCGPSMVFTNVLNPRAAIERKDAFRDTIVKRGVSIGANATIICGNTLGVYSMIGAGAVVSKSTKDFSLLTGIPAKQIGWMSAYGEKLDLPLSGNGEYICSNQNVKYILKENILSYEEL